MIYLRINGKEQYNKVHRILTSFNQPVYHKDKEAMDNGRWEGEDLIIKYNSGVWALYNRTSYQTNGISVIDLYNQLESGTLFKPLDRQNDVVEVLSQSQAEALAKYHGYKFSSPHWFKDVAIEQEGLISAHVYLYAFGFDRLVTVKAENKNIISFEEFQLRKDIK